MSNSKTKAVYLSLCAAAFDALSTRIDSLGPRDRLPMDEAEELAQSGATCLKLAVVAYDSVEPGRLTVVTRGRAPSIHLSQTEEEKKAAIKEQAKDRMAAAKAAAAAKDKRIAELEAALARQSAPVVVEETPDSSTGLAVVEWDTDLATVG